MKVAFIGGGMMAEAMLSAIITKGALSPEAITVSDIDQNRLKLLRERYGIQCTSDNCRAIQGKDIIILAIKPQIVCEVATALRLELRPDQSVLSVLAGVGIAALKQYLGHDAIIRVMPNTPSQIGEGMSVWTATERVPSDHKRMVSTILAAMGKEIYFDAEKYIDMATAISGSGPAYVFLITEALTDAAVHIGLPRKIASELVLQTFLGSVRLAQASDKHLAELRNMVTSPGGTTAAGLLRLEGGGLRATLTQTVIAAYQKAQELGKSS
ncbi:pyrroline-5-carboxylate reductase [Candidatus Acetothermia bacterium]|nr:pyrroline-5-carboxylate reductase [Candidatus Acetothermia bacterium]MCI2426618.1 pyrroline-5-carboxylate reductase [Candidatus Acetothermia bacterium]MCI2427899.1 pyrroline-5-carboxylate reductase [Candidatus Acetothermia bacterium]MCI2428098.1 pyrroline-5-carboxylate reductase [Candidatus Acetothermia bacterium]